MSLYLPDTPALLNASMQRLASQSSSCKLWSIVLSSLVLVMAAGRAGAEILVWAAAPIFLLGLADAAYTAQVRRLATLAAKESIPANELFGLLVGEGGFSASLQPLSGLASFSVWPFYTALALMVVVLGQFVLPAKNGPSFPSQFPPITSGPFQPGTPRPSYTIQQGAPSMPPGAMAYPQNSNIMLGNGYPIQNGAPSFQPPNQTVTRPNIPPMGVPVPQPKPQGFSTKQLVAPKSPSANNLPAPATSSSRSTQGTGSSAVQRNNQQTTPAKAQSQQ